MSPAAMISFVILLFLGNPSNAGPAKASPQTGKITPGSLKVPKLAQSYLDARTRYTQTFTRLRILREADIRATALGSKLVTTLVDPNASAETKKQASARLRKLRTTHDNIKNDYTSEAYPEQNTAFDALGDAADKLADAKKKLGYSEKELVRAGKGHPGVTQYLEDVKTGYGAAQTQKEPQPRHLDVPKLSQDYLDASNRHDQTHARLVLLREANIRATALRTKLRAATTNRNTPAQVKQQKSASLGKLRTLQGKIERKYTNEAYPEDNEAFGALYDATEKLADAKSILAPGHSPKGLKYAGISNQAGVRKFLADTREGYKGFEVWDPVEE